MLRVYRRLVAAGDRALADEVATVLLTPLRDELRVIDRRADKAGWAQQNERIADMMDELGRELIAMDNMKHAYDAWVELDDRQSACRCALKLAQITYYADLEKDSVFWTDKVIESGSDYATTAEAYRLQVKSLRSLDRFGAAQDTLKYYLDHIEKYSGGSRAEFAAHRIMSATLFFETGNYEACLRALNDWYEFVEDKFRAKPFLDANTGVVLAKILLLDQARIMLEAAANQVSEDGYRLRHPSDYSDFRHYFGSYDPKDPDSMPAFMECILG
jgi:tetratricopeptide (TPR) repeat protein